MGMIQRSYRAGFAFKTLAELSLRDLVCDNAIQSPISGLVNLAHSARTDGRKCVPAWRPEAGSRSRPDAMPATVFAAATNFSALQKTTLPAGASCSEQKHADLIICRDRKYVHIGCDPRRAGSEVQAQETFPSDAPALLRSPEKRYCPEAHRERCRLGELKPSHDPCPEFRFSSVSKGRMPDVAQEPHQANQLSRFGYRLLS
jgi:hypothetical protein